MEYENGNAPNVRVAILKEAEYLMEGNRIQTYGHPYPFLRTFAALAGECIGHPVTPHQGALMLVCLKMARAIVAPTHKDSYVDACNYLTMAYEAAMVDGGQIPHPGGTPISSNTLNKAYQELAESLKAVVDGGVA